MKGKQNQELKVMKELPFEVMKRIGSFLEDISVDYYSPHLEARTKIAFSQTCRAFYDPNIPKRAVAIGHLEDFAAFAGWLCDGVDLHEDGVHFFISDKKSYNSDLHNFLHNGHIVYNQYIKNDEFINIGLTAEYAGYMIRKLTAGVESIPSHKAPQWLQEFVTEKGLIFMDQHLSLIHI